MMVQFSVDERIETGVRNLYHVKYIVTLEGRAVRHSVKPEYVSEKEYVEWELAAEEGDHNCEPEN